MHQTLTLEKKGFVGVIRIDSLPNNREEMVQLSSDLVQLCDQVIWDKEIRVVFPAGVGEKFFSIAINSLGPVLCVDNGYRLETEFKPLVEPIAKLDRTVIITINGDAMGQGLELALACDIRIASETSRFGLPEIKSGLIPWDGGTQRLSRLVGKSKALEMILTGEVIDAQEALRFAIFKS